MAFTDGPATSQAAERIWAEAPQADVQAITLDLASLASVRAAAAELRSRCQRIDVLINNAGVMWAPKGQTADGFETHFGTNHLGHFAFTGLVLDLLFAQALQARLAQAHVPTIAVAAHPGGARTELNRHMPLAFRGRSWGLARPITHPAEIGALSIARAAADPGIHGNAYIGPSGWHEFTGHPALIQPSERARNPELQRRLWHESERLTGVTYPLSPATV